MQQQLQHSSLEGQVVVRVVINDISHPRGAAVKMRDVECQSVDFEYVQMTAILLDDAMLGEHLLQVGKVALAAVKGPQVAHYRE